MRQLQCGNAKGDYLMNDVLSLIIALTLSSLHVVKSSLKDAVDNDDDADIDDQMISGSEFEDQKNNQIKAVNDLDEKYTRGFNHKRTKDR